jgi:hypothetical protein
MTRPPTPRLASATLSVAVIAVALAASIPATAQASEPISSLKTTLIEANAFGENGEVAAAGTIIGVPGPESFSVETYSGTTVTVEVPVPLRFIDPHQPDAVIGLSNLGGGKAVESGASVVVFGLVHGAAVIARQVLITFPGEEPSNLNGFAAAGIVQAAPSGEGFVIETRGGSTDTVEVSSSTTYARARPAPSEPSPTLGDLASGDYVGVSGTLSGNTVTAARVLISTPQAGAHPDLTTEFTLQSPGQPEAAQ